MPRSAETITVAAAQIRARLMNEASESLADIAAAIERAAQRRVDLLVLPECAYPAYLLGSVEWYRQGDHLSSEQFLKWLSEQAAEHRLHIICGFVEDGGSTLYNSAVLMDDTGRELGRARKRFLWHVDHEWFAPGEEIRAFDTALGRIGIAICAEARDPELIATLVADGAELIALPTCWINATREPGRYENPQVEYMIEARAREFGVPFVCADKYGVELALVGYVGQSRIVRADGSLAAEAPSTGDEVIASRLQLRPAPRLWVGDARRERLLREPPVQIASGQPKPVTLAAVPTSTAGQMFATDATTTTRSLEAMRSAGVSLMLVNMPHEEPAEKLGMLARAYGIHMVGWPTEAKVFEWGPARAGCMAGQWVRSFAAGRALALDGAEILLCFDTPPDLPMLRTRALENRIFLTAAGDRWAYIIGPDGTVLAQCGTESPAAITASVDLAEAANKLVAPGTDIFNERKPKLLRF